MWRSEEVLSSMPKGKIVGKLALFVWLLTISVLVLMSTVMLGDQVGKMAFINSKQVYWH